MKALKNAKPAQLKFKDLPRDYETLCRNILLPRPIRSRAEYQEIAAITDTMAPHIQKFTRGQDEYFEMLSSLLEDYDRDKDAWPKISGIEALQHLLAENNMTPADLSRLIGGSRNLGSMILRGDRNLTLDHIRILANRFGVSSDLFIKN